MLSGYADYLVGATLTPALQFVMPDGRVIGTAANQTNVALAGIIAIRAMAELSAAKGDATASAKYKVCIVSSHVRAKVLMVMQEIAENYITQWQGLAVTTDGSHLSFVVSLWWPCLFTDGTDIIPRSTMMM